MANKLLNGFYVSPEIIKENLINDLRDELNSFYQNLNNSKQEEYLTRNEVSKILKVSLVTLHDWNKKNILNSYRLGNIIRYKRSEIDKSLVRIHSNQTNMDCHG